MACPAACGIRRSSGSPRIPIKIHSLSHFILQPASSTKVSRLLSIDPRLVSHRERVHGTAYNADMGTNPGAILDQATAVDAWLLQGAVLVATSDRATRTLQAQ